MICTVWITQRRGRYIQVPIVTQVKLDPQEESLVETTALKVPLADLEEDGPMVVVAVTIDLTTGHITLSIVAMVMVTIKDKVKAHLKVIEAEQCPQEDQSTMAMEAGLHLLVGLEVIGLNPITINLLEEELSLITMPGRPEVAGMDTM